MSKHILIEEALGSCESYQRLVNRVVALEDKIKKYEEAIRNGCISV